MASSSVARTSGYVAQSWDGFFAHYGSAQHYTTDVTRTLGRMKGKGQFGIRACAVHNQTLGEMRHSAARLFYLSGERFQPPEEQEPDLGVSDDEHHEPEHIDDDGEAEAVADAHALRAAYDLIRRARPLDDLRTHPRQCLEVHGYATIVPTSIRKMRAFALGLAQLLRRLRGRRAPFIVERCDERVRVDAQTTERGGRCAGGPVRRGGG
jgi:hypothetical protein